MEDWKNLQKKAAEEEYRRREARRLQEEAQRINLERDSRQIHEKYLRDVEEQERLFRTIAATHLDALGAQRMLDGIRRQIWKGGNISDIFLEGKRSKSYNTVSRFGNVQNSSLRSDDHTKYFLKALAYKGKFRYTHVAIGVSSTMSMGGDFWTFNPGREKLFVESVDGPVWMNLGAMYDAGYTEQRDRGIRVTRSPIDLPVSPRSVLAVQNALALDCGFREANKVLPADLKK